MRIEIRIVVLALALAGATAIAQDYRRFTPDEPLLDWRAANEAVRQAGGHAGMHGHAQDAKALPKGEASRGVPEKAPSKAASPGHAGHGSHGVPGGKP
jgi:hypothetical protein